MSKTIYKTHYFNCVFSMGKRFSKQLQEAIDKNVVDGWKLHSWHVPGLLGEICCLVFYKEEDE